MSYSNKVLSVSDTQHTDIIHLHQALELAKIRRGFCAPNPSVGAIIANEQGEVVAAGFHHEAGAAHAEIAALQQLSSPSLAKNATMYVTLEPCCHWGKTPPCTEALLKAGLKRVVYGYRDPNPIVAGQGAQALQAGGVVCDYVPTPEIQSFYTSYAYWLKTKKPFVTSKIAMTLNGKIAGPRGERVQITGETLQEFTHYMRKHSDAILTTAKTIIADNPQMNARYLGEVHAKPIYIVDRHLATPLTSAIFSTAKTVTIFYGQNPDAEKLSQLQAQGIRCFEMVVTQQGLSLPHIIEQVGADGIHDLWIEAGGALFSALMTEQLLQHAFLYIAPQWIHQGMPAFTTDFSLIDAAQRVHWEQMGSDVLCEVHWYT